MRHALRRTAGILAIGGAAVLLRPGTPANLRARREIEAAGRRVRYLEGRLQGVRYRLSGGHPEPDVIDTVLADRVRSSIGSLEKRLDVPHVHVLAEDHVVHLHGEVGSERDVAEIEQAVAAVPGVVGVESHLHVGLGRGVTRPSVGRTS